VETYSYSENRQRIYFSAVLLCLWAVYLLQRSLVGFEMVSDERFFLLVDVEGETKRRLYLYLVQLLGKSDLARIVLSCLNISLVIFSFNLMIRINHGAIVLTFLQLLYFASIATYVFRDSVILFCVALIAYGLTQRRSGLTWYMVFALVLLVDLRPHAAVVSLAALVWVWALQIARSRGLTYWFVGLSILFTLLTWNVVLSSIQLRGVTAWEFLGYLQKNHGYGSGIISFLEILVRHYLAPIPTSLITRVLDPFMESPYGNIDDLYRFAYKATLYCVIGYVLLSWKFASAAVQLNVRLFNFLAVFSVGNAVIYSLFSGGGGHERTKVFSTLIIFYLAAAIHQVKNLHRVDERAQ